LELQWKNKEKSLIIDYDNGSKIHWVSKDSLLINERRTFLSYDSQNEISNSQAVLNSLILGDNIFVLNSLIEIFSDYPENEKIKFVYIDPPYNTLNPELSYQDNLKHNEWLTFIKDRLERIKPILRPDGIICIQIDDKEFARLFLLMVELFEEKNLKTIVVKMSESSGLKMQSAKLGGIPKLKEYIILAKMDGIHGFHFESIPKKHWDPEYNIFIKNYSLANREFIKSIQGKKITSEDDIQHIDAICRNFELVSVNKILEEEKISEQNRDTFFNENSWRICRTASSKSILKLVEKKKSEMKYFQQVFSVVSNKGILYLVKSDYTPGSRKPRVQILFAENHLLTSLGDLWTDIKTTGLEFEGKINFKNSKKPEKLMKRLIEGSTDKNDLILDLFCGSGTTLSVALELNRKFIGVEVSKEIFLLARKRLENKIDLLNKMEKKIDFQISFLKIVNTIHKI
jgi:adenine-specific DNA-methyltransferase